MVKRLSPLAGWFRSTEWADATCPSCQIGYLRADNAVEQESTASLDAHNHEAWEPEWISGYFTCALRCQRVQCREIAVALGVWQVREEWDDRGPFHVSYYRLEMTTPPLPILRTPEKCPARVREAVAGAARVVWVDPSAAASRLRVAIELLLDSRRIPRSTTAGGERTSLRLHARIDRLRKTNPAVADLLEAVKWIGNQGSHEDSLETTDVLDGAELLEHALALLYDPTPTQIQRRARQINKAKRVRGRRNAPER